MDRDYLAEFDATLRKGDFATFKKDASDILTDLVHEYETNVRQLAESADYFDTRYLHLFKEMAEESAHPVRTIIYRCLSSTPIIKRHFGYKPALERIVKETILAPKIRLNWEFKKEEGNGNPEKYLTSQIPDELKEIENKNPKLYERRLDLIAGYAYSHIAPEFRTYLGYLADFFSAIEKTSAFASKMKESCKDTDTVLFYHVYDDVISTRNALKSYIKTSEVSSKLLVTLDSLSQIEEFRPYLAEHASGSFIPPSPN